MLFEDTITTTFKHIEEYTDSKSFSIVYVMFSDFVTITNCDKK